MNKYRPSVCLYNYTDKRLLGLIAKFILKKKNMAKSTIVSDIKIRKTVIKYKAL